MSGMALIWAANVRGLAPATKIVLIQLAERHNKDTGRCDPSLAKLAEDCEMGRSTLLRHITELEEAGLLSRVAKGREGGGRASSQYDLHVGAEQRSRSGTIGEQRSRSEQAKVPMLAGKGPDNGTGYIEPVLNQEGTDTRARRAASSQQDLLTEEEAPKVDPFDEFWEAFPPGRKTDKPKARAKFWAIVRGTAKGLEKAPAETLTQAARNYAASNPDPQFTPMPTTWLNGERWREWGEAPVARRSRHEPPSHIPRYL